MSVRTRLFGRTQIPVSEIGHGTWAMGFMWGFSDDAASVKALIHAIERGVNFIDTAWVYGRGRSEKIIAEALLALPETFVTVASKVPPKNMVWPASHQIPVGQVFPGSHIIDYTEKTLRNLKRETLDLQQMHVWSDAWLNQGDWMDAVERLKRQGKIRYFGVSINDHEPDSALEVVKSGLVDSVQVIYNIFDQSPAERLFPLCIEHGVAVIARVPFDEGSLTGTLTPDTQFDPADWRTRYFGGSRLAETCERVARIQKLTQNEGETLAQTALRFCLSHSAVSVVIPGMRTIQHVDENCAVSDGRLLSESLLLALKGERWGRNFYAH